MKINGEVRPWGEFTTFTNNEKSTVKILKVNKGQILSIQSHKKRDEFWYVLDGHIQVLQHEEWIDAYEGDKFFIKKEDIHSIQGITNGRILEISFGHFDEDDIKRYSDVYERT